MLRTGSQERKGLLPDDLQLDAVTLNVGDMELMSSYYSDSLELIPLEEKVVDGRLRRVLGRGEDPLVRLVHTPGLPGVDSREAGLFHTAFLFKEQSALAASIYRSASTPGNRFVGASDHLVSEAFYFTDPEGNGIELYWDRPREMWDVQGGKVNMATLYLDPNEFLAKHLTEDSVTALSDAETSVGHVHLQVGDIAPARKFYVEALGFDITADNYPGALFTSAGGYHHHLAMNIWNSKGAGPRAARLGLGNVSVIVPAREDLDQLTARLTRSGTDFADSGNSVATQDPWGTRITVSLPNTGAKDLLER